jgi:hypothetical protein
MRTTTVTAHLDHVVVMLDPTAYRAVLHSTALPLFGRFSVKESESSLAGRYSGATVVGHSTMVELFDVTAPPLPGITGGLVLSFEQPGSSNTAKELLESAGVPFTHELVRRVVDGDAEMRPWYHLIRPDLGEGNPFLLMIAEVTPEYYTHIGAVPGDDGTLSRAGYLDAQLGGSAAPDQPMGDVTEVVLQLRADLAARLEEVLVALGYESTLDGLVGPGVSVRIERGEPTGVLWVGITASTQDSIEEPFGDSSTFSLRADRAGWSFTPTSA